MQIPHIQASIRSASSFIELLTVIKEADADVSFWGMRYVNAVGYEGTDSLDTLTGRVIELFEKKKRLNLVKKSVRRASP